MMGQKKLSEIRKELQEALSSDGADDPIRWLEERITASERERPEKSEVLRSLKRILETKPAKQNRRRIRAKK